MKVRHLLLFVSFFMVTMLRAGTDDLENLIEEHKDIPIEEADGDLPPVYLLGDEKGVEIYSPSASGNRPNLLCLPADLDEWIEMSRGQTNDLETILNLSFPRVRAIVEETCLVRPGDLFLAVSASTQQFVTVKEFVVKREAAVCPSDPPYSLWMTLETTLNEKPFFFSSDLDLREGASGFRSASTLTLDSKALSKRDWQDMTAFPNEYISQVFLVNAPNCARLVQIKRKTVSNDDEGFLNEGLFCDDGDRLQKIWEEKVDGRNGAGHVRLDGFLDYNQDGMVDLLISGDHRKCPYIEVLQGATDGFVPIELPNKPCGC